MLGGLILAFVGIAFLICFIHHISMSIQASSIIAAAAKETIAAVDHLFPEGLGRDAEEAASGASTAAAGESIWTAISAAETGYIESVDGDTLLTLARELGTILRMDRGVGEFVVEGSPLASVLGARKMPDDLKNRLNSVMSSAANARFNRMLRLAYGRLSTLP